MILLTVSEFFRNIKRNGIITLLLSVMGVILCAVYGIFAYERNAMAPFENFEGRRGYMVASSTLDEHCIDATDEIYSVYYTGYLQSDDQEEHGGIYIAPEWVTDKWKPRLKEGSFCAKPRSDGTIPVVVFGEDSEEFSVGTTIDTNLVDGRRVRFEVTGIAVPNSKMIGAGSSYKIGEVDYRMFYDIPYIGVSFLCGEKAFGEWSDFVIQTTNCVITVDDSVSDEQFEKKYMNVQLDTGNTCMKLDEFMEASREIYMQKILAYIPLLIVGIIVVVICCYSAVCVNYRYSIGHYTIFYLVGGKPRQRLIISLGNGFGIVAFSAAITGSVIKYINGSTLGEKLMLIVDKNMILMLVIFYMAFMLMMTVVTWLSMKGMSPKEQLIKNRG